MVLTFSLPLCTEVSWKSPSTETHEITIPFVVLFKIRCFLLQIFKFFYFNSEKNIFICGFELLYLFWNPAPDSHHFDKILKNLGDCGFQPVVDFPTRQQNTLDFLFSKSFFLYNIVCLDSITFIDSFIIESLFNCAYFTKMTTSPSCSDISLELCY